MFDFFYFLLIQLYTLCVGPLKRHIFLDRPKTGMLCFGAQMQALRPLPPERHSDPWPPDTLGEWVLNLMSLWLMTSREGAAFLLINVRVFMG